MRDEKKIDEFIHQNISEKAKKEGGLNHYYINAYTESYKASYQKIMEEMAVKLHTKGLPIKEILDLVDLTDDEFIKVITGHSQEKGYYRGVQNTLNELKKSLKDGEITAEILENIANTIKEKKGG